MSFAFHHPIDDPDQPLRARALRYVLLDELRRRPRMTVAEMVATLSGAGFTFTDRASKVISDALRWEVRAGRVERLARGVYRFRPTTPWTTMRRVVLFARVARRWVEARTAGLPTPPTPPDPRADPRRQPLPPDRPPWASLGWLWTS